MNWVWQTGPPARERYRRAGRNRRPARNRLNCPGREVKFSCVAESPGKVSGANPAVQNHARKFSDYIYVYPVISRRSRGLSLGINLNPDKRCNFDCIYCEVDRHTPGRAREVDATRLQSELTSLIQFVKQGGLCQHGHFALAQPYLAEIQDLAFSGDGEPTMVPNFEECVRIAAGVKAAEGLPKTKLVLITNAAGLDKADVQRGLEIMDANQGEIWGKLDAGTEAYYRLVNRSSIQLDRLLHNLLRTARVRPIIIQTLLLKVHGEMMSPAELAAYCGRLKWLLEGGARITEVHAYTVARPTPEAFATKLTPTELENLAGQIRQQTSLPVTTFA